MRSRTLSIATGLIGAFLAAVGTGIVSSCGYAIIRVLTSGPGAEAKMGEGLAFIAVNAMYVSASIALPTILLAALPHVIISNRLRHSSRKYYLWSGVAIGLLVVIAVGVRQHMHPGPPLRIGPDEWLFVLSALGAGAIAALVFWIVARPDRGWHQQSGEQVSPRA